MPAQQSEILIQSATANPQLENHRKPSQKVRSDASDKRSNTAVPDLPRPHRSVT
jgi:hypothetical protein